MKQAIWAAVLVGGCAALFACSGGSDIGIDPESTTPQNPAVVTSATGLAVTVTLASAALGSDCGGGASSPARGASDSAICAAEPDGGTSKCGSTSVCQQTNMQLKVAANGGAGSASVEIVTVRLLESKTLQQVSTLTSREPQVWNGSAYGPWDETVATGASLNVSYKLSSPKWEGDGSNGSWNSYNSNYVLEVVIRVNGVQRTLHSQELSRAPLVAT